MNALIEITLNQRAITLVYCQNTIINKYWEKLKQEKILTMMNMWKKKITTILIVMNLILMPINNYYYVFNLFWTTKGETALIACKTPTNVISSVSLPEHI